MKFYWKDDDFYAKMITSQLSYGYEFCNLILLLLIIFNYY